MSVQNYNHITSGLLSTNYSGADKTLALRGPYQFNLAIKSCDFWRTGVEHTVDGSHQCRPTFVNKHYDYTSCGKF
ncbi:hypothetical protein BpHYR1_036220 [Brachionus plicatilis]|uniref:Uncharacterized protein n=1 Tax=Brachionus plicatilis TaxID=10195 RepID=A0A3M7S458_BRAPC|nr:hypothetical protein BpHYR1_036220 [Brachionus plicatilis]